MEVIIVTGILNFHQLAKDIISIDGLAFLKNQQLVVIRFRAANAINAADRRNDDDVPTSSNERVAACRMRSIHR